MSYLAECIWTHLECSCCGEYDVILADEHFAPDCMPLSYCDSHAFVTGRCIGAAARAVPYISRPRAFGRVPKSLAGRGRPRKVRDSAAAV